MKLDLKKFECLMKEHFPNRPYSFESIISDDGTFKIECFHSNCEDLKNITRDVFGISISCSYGDDIYQHKSHVIETEKREVIWTKDYK